MDPFLFHEVADISLADVFAKDMSSLSYVL